ncbi:MAG: ATP-binding protein, partial [Candidatus Promineifilaceae bacterium]
MLQEDQLVERQRLETAITTLEAQRGILGDQVVESSVTALRRQLAELLPRFIDRERKLVTVLFADVSGFTALADDMDPEFVGEIINTLWRRLDKVITNHGGYIDKHVGDGVMALWGVKSAQEDDPERAIRAALEMQAELVVFREEIHKDLEMRIGINSGPVVLGQVGTTAEFTAIGDTVNTADRLQKVAPVGTVFVSHNTFQHVRGIFDVSPMEPIAVRGKREPLQVYIVRRAKARSFHTWRRGVEGVETRMIGRAFETRQLEGMISDVIENSRRQAVTIIGDAGIGKSRLLYEFENWVDLLDTDVFLMRGRARQSNQQVPFGLFLDVFSFRFDIREDDSSAVVREKLEQGFREVHEPVHKHMAHDEIKMRSHFAGHLLGYNLGESAYLAPVLTDPKQIRERATTYILDYVQDAATSDPVLLMVEDLHMADDSSLELLDMMAHRLADYPIFILATARPEFYERQPDWFENHKYQSRISLKPLSLRENRTLVYEILKLAEDIPDTVGNLIIDNSEGNPLYVEELVKMLIDEGAILKGEDTWKIHLENLAALSVPATLAGILQARLDILSDLQKSILQQASVIGRVFWDSAILYLNEFEPEDVTLADIEKALDRLREREMIFKRKVSTFSQATEYTFNHAILREVAYESVLMRNRSRYHGLIADWLGAQSSERSAEMVAMTADHLIRADRATEAVQDLLLAGQLAAARFANEEARLYLTRALELASEEESPIRFDLLSEREKVYHMLGRRDEQKADLEALEQLALMMSPLEKAYVSLRFASFAEATSDYESMIVAARNAIAYVSEDGPPEILSRSHLEWGTALERLGRYQQAHDQFERAL